MSKPIIELSIENLYDASLLEKELNDLSNVFNSTEFKTFIGEKCLKILDNLTQNNLGTFNEHSIFDAKVEEYIKNCKYKLENDYIVIYNETTLTQQEMTWVSDKTKENYPEGISIAYIIEYGTGLLGDSNSENEWEVNINNYKSSWSYKDPEGRIRHTQGIEGRYIYDKMMQEVEIDFADWVEEYLKLKMEV